jgi:hypothetical protein
LHAKVKEEAKKCNLSYGRKNAFFRHCLVLRQISIASSRRVLYNISVTYRIVMMPEILLRIESHFYDSN